MGLILAANCACGLHAEVLVGSGMTEGSGGLPAYCKRCELLVSVSAHSARPRCNQCRGNLKPIPIFDAAQPGREETPSAPLPCPRCGNQSLRFDDIGLWD